MVHLTKKLISIKPPTAKQKNLSESEQSGPKNYDVGNDPTCKRDASQRNLALANRRWPSFPTVFREGAVIIHEPDTNIEEVLVVLSCKLVRFLCAHCNLKSKLVAETVWIKLFERLENVFSSACSRLLISSD